MQKYFPWIIAGLAVILALFMYIENRRVLHNLEKSVQVQVPQGVQPLTSPGTSVQPSVTAPSSGKTPTSTSFQRNTSSLANVPPLLHLSGRCVQSDGTPLEGARITGVFLLPSSQEQKKDIRTTVTAAGGDFALPFIPGERLELLRSELDGFVASEVFSLELPTTPVLLAMSRLGTCELQVFRIGTDQQFDRYNGEATIYVMRRRPTEQEQPGARVALEGTSGPGRFVTIGAERAIVKQGLHRLVGYPPGIYKVAVEAGEEYAESEPFKLEESTTSIATVVFGTRQRFGGYVYEEGTQRPIAGAKAKLKLQKQPSPAVGAHLEQRTIADDLGHFIFEKVVPGVYVLTLEADGYSTKVLEEITIPATNEPLPEQIYYLTRGSPRLRVKVVGADGQQGIKGAKLALLSVGTQRGKTFFSSTDERGEAVFDQLVADRYLLSVSVADGHMRQKQTEVVVRESGVSEVVVQFAKTIRISGVARDAAGQAFNGLIYFVPRGSLGPKTFAKCNSEGNFDVELEPGDYSVGRADAPASKPVKIPAIDNFRLELVIQ